MLERPDAVLEAQRRDLPQRTAVGRVMTETIPIKKLNGRPPFWCFRCHKGNMIMEALKSTSLENIIKIATQTNDPVGFGKALLTYIGAELSDAIRTELAARIEAQKAMTKEARVLA